MLLDFSLNVAIWFDFGARITEVYVPIVVRFSMSCIVKIGVWCCNFVLDGDVIWMVMYSLACIEVDGNDSERRRLD